MGSFCPPCLLPLFVTQFGFLKSPPCLLPVFVTQCGFFLPCLPAARSPSLWVSLCFFCLSECRLFLYLSDRTDQGYYLHFATLTRRFQFPKVRTAPSTDLFVCCPSNHFVGLIFLPCLLLPVWLSLLKPPLLISLFVFF